MNLLKRRKAMAKNSKLCLKVVLLFCIVLGLAVSAKVRAAEPPPIFESPTFIDHDGDGIDDNLEQYLANLYAPVIYIIYDEPNYPVNVDWFLENADLYYCDHCTLLPNHNPIATPVGTPQWNLFRTVDNGQSSTDPDPESFGELFFLHDLPDALQNGCMNPSDWKTYVHVYPNIFGGITIQYWHVFAYNKFDLFGFGNHGGDWDAEIQVVLDGNLNPVKAWFSRHSDDHPGYPFQWSQLHTYQGTHIMMTIDRGGHAAFKDLDDCQQYWGHIACSASWQDNPDVPGFGTVWKTWDGGEVRQDNLVQPLYAISPNPGVSGGIVNVGEYNPGKQESSLLAGRAASPLNNQFFIMYSGLWGSPGIKFSGPRGPVFQGYDSGIYKSWYNEAANEPTSPATQWRQGPTTSFTLTGLTSFDGTHNYISGATTASFIVDQNPVAASYGNPRTYYRIYPVGGVAPTFNRVSGAFALPAEPDGYYLLQYYSMDALNNQEMDNQGFPKVSSLVFTKLNKLNSTGVYFMAGGYRATASMDVSMTTPNLMPSGWLKFNYRTSTMTCYLSSTQLTEAWMLSDKKTMMIGGFATVNNQPGYYFWAGATDNGSPGAGLDQFSITVLDPQRKTFLYIPSTTISGGDLVIKPLY
jgi:hypothetical protein